MADGDSGIEGEVGNHTEEIIESEVPQENGESEHVEEQVDNDVQEHVEETVEETEPNHIIEDEKEEQPPEEDDNRPVVELFVKAAVDKMKNGSCPICHRYFMMFYLLREHGLIDLVVTTFVPENPPKEVVEFTNSKRPPLVYVHKGLNTMGMSIVGPYDTTDEIENLLVKDLRSELTSNRTDSVDESEAEGSFDNLYKYFNLFLKNDKTTDPSMMKKVLERVNDHLRSQEQEDKRFMVTNELRRADCHLLPWLQHIRVAGKAYKNFEIPTELTYLWRYLQNAYETDAFKESCPADREIISHYEDKVSAEKKVKVGKASRLMGEVRTFSIPPEITTNGDGGD